MSFRHRKFYSGYTLISGKAIKETPIKRIADSETWLPLPWVSSGINVTLTDFPVSLDTIRPGCVFSTKDVLSQNPVSAGLPKLAIVDPRYLDEVSLTCCDAARRS